MNLKDGEVFIDKAGNLFVSNLKEFQTQQGIIPPEAYDKVQENMHTMIFGDTIDSHPNSPGRIDPSKQGANLLMSPTNPPGSDTSNPIDTSLDSSQIKEDNPDNPADQSSANTDINSDSFISTEPQSGDHLVTATCKEGDTLQGNTQGSSGEDCVGQPETPQIIGGEDVPSSVYAEDLESPIEVRGGDESQAPEPEYEIEEEEDGSVIINTKPKDDVTQPKMPEIIPESEPLPEGETGCESGYDSEDDEDIELMNPDEDDGVELSYMEEGEEVELFNMEEDVDEEVEFSIDEEEIGNYVKDKMASSQAEKHDDVKSQEKESKEAKDEL